VKGDPEHPASRGYTCAKGRSLGRWHHHSQRILEPRRRRGSDWERQSWSAAIDDVASIIGNSIEAYGPDSFGVYIGTAASLDGAGKWAAEQLPRLLGSRSKYSAISIDNPCKPLVSLLMSGHPGLVPVLDDQRCTFTMFLGCNPVVSHGHLNGLPDPVVRLREIATAPRELWVVDTRATESSRLATGVLRPRPGTDFAIIAFLIHELLENGGCDSTYLEKHTSPDDVRTIRGLLGEWTATRASEVTGCAVDELITLLSAVRRHGRLSVQTGTGSTMTAAANVTEWLVWVLHIVTGSYDVPGGMWFHPGFLRQMYPGLQQNSALPTPLPGPRSRPELKVWGDEYPCSALVDEIEAGNLRVLVVFGGNPLSAFPDAQRTADALQNLDALIVLDVVDNEMSEIATHVLPARGQLERADIPVYYDQFNLDFSTQFTPAVVPPAGESRSMWWISARIAEELGTSILPHPLTTASTDVDVLRFVAARSFVPFDEIVNKRYVSASPPFGWVLESVLPDNRWRLVPQEFVDQIQRWRELVPPKGLLLTSRRQPRQLNSQIPRMAPDNVDEPIAIIHPDVAAAREILDGEWVIVSSPFGSIEVRARVSADLHRDSVSITHGRREANVSMLTSGSDVDELTGMVVQTAIPVDVHRR
jgi:anaerobic selenocysteine-containing dehydrogenase